MITRIADLSPNKTARIAGFFYLLNALSAGFAEYFRRSVILTGDATATVHNIMASPWLFRASVASDLFAQTSQILLVLFLYILLKPVNKNYALLMVLFVMTFVPMVCINMVNQFAALILLSGAGYLTAFNAGQLNALVMLFLDLHNHGYVIVDIFFGLWLFPLGYLVFKSGYFPKILGVLLMIGCLGYLLKFAETFLLPGYDAITYPGLAISTIAESSFVLWLLLKGAKISEVKS